MWGSGSQSPFGAGSQSPGGLHGFSQEFGFSQSQTQAFEPSQSTYGLSQASQLSQPAVPECTECQSTEMSTTDDGDMVCSVCGTAYEGNVNEVVEVEEGMLVGISRRRLRKDNTAMGPKLDYKGRPLVFADTRHCLRAFQIILVRHVKAFCSAAALSSEATEEMKRLSSDVWFKYLERFTLPEACGHGGIRVRDDFRSDREKAEMRARLGKGSGSGVKGGGDADSEGRGGRKAVGPVNVDAKELAAHGRGKHMWDETVRAARSSPGYSVPPVSMPLIPAILCLCARWLRSPVLAVDVVRWITDGSLPYVGSIELLPEDMKAGLGKARSFFKPIRVPSAVHVTILADRLAALLGLEGCPDWESWSFVRPALLPPPGVATSTSGRGGVGGGGGAGGVTRHGADERSDGELGVGEEDSEEDSDSDDRDADGFGGAAAARTGGSREATRRLASGGKDSRGGSGGGSFGPCFVPTHPEELRLLLRGRLPEYLGYVEKWLGGDGRFGSWLGTADETPVMLEKLAEEIEKRRRNGGSGGSNGAATAAAKKTPRPRSRAGDHGDTESAEALLMGCVRAAQVAAGCRSDDRLALAKHNDVKEKHAAEGMGGGDGDDDDGEDGAEGGGSGGRKKLKRTVEDPIPKKAVRWRCRLGVRSGAMLTAKKELGPAVVYDPTDRISRFHPAYELLVEACAFYLQVRPVLLHEKVEELDAILIEQATRQLRREEKPSGYEVWEGVEKEEEKRQKALARAEAHARESHRPRTLKTKVALDARRRKTRDFCLSLRATNNKNIIRSRPFVGVSPRHFTAPSTTPCHTFPSSPAGGGEKKAEKTAAKSKRPVRKLQREQGHLLRRGLLNAVDRRGVFERESDYSIEQRAMPFLLDQPRRTEG
ncbi:unnamed protein product [Scytosiphon promiscuus]